MVYTTLVTLCQETKKNLMWIQEMFKALVDGELYDPERFGQYYAAGLNTGLQSVTATTI